MHINSVRTCVRILWRESTGEVNAVSMLIVNDVLLRDESFSTSISI